MTIIVHDKGVIIKGKAWEVRKALKHYSKQHNTIHDWIQSVHA
ncbi:Z-ring formation inhibitor MciZ [Heyndrickxia ginsengihumi]|uniref:PadR family transcriptional regulator n=1 Tax=Heyndrickxia ginsengihumi TaxID=363870 RepID=A0A0A6VCJ9_9BACI|nr:Z-ring formation inhibitor MciZ [Heyndrickxia ginsengihumi]KHD86025.1 PadR family transcriptional regulator [Heyndrickxia ginsengihumi]MBE6182919.1 Z-ring formation inhibitor MciZ [Bacillus sp. (in: firmicutes)]MCM3022857.1 Z-ring formation inhibitor MciZ [Heyndrickxia ginsengihumi]NEY20125.1 Z-ring formation inhibitor MciZ [Heyndrickxia ginsengihumi]